MDSKLVAFLDASNRSDAIQQLTDLLYKEGKIDDKERFLKAIFNREKIISTGIGMGVAIPHARLPCYSSFFLAIGILKMGVDWEALDGAPVRLIFLVGGPDDRQTEYLQILSSLTLAIRSEQKRKKILHAHEAREIISCFE